MTHAEMKPREARRDGQKEEEKKATKSKSAKVNAGI